MEVDEDPFAYIILNVDVEIRRMVGVWENTYLSDTFNEIIRSSYIGI